MPLRGELPTWWGAESALFGFGFPLFDQQHRNAVDDGIKDLAVRAAKVVGLFELELGVALGTGQNLEQFLRDHAFMVVPFRP
jgi:hypothetical protein